MEKIVCCLKTIGNMIIVMFFCCATKWNVLIINNYMRWWDLYGIMNSWSDSPVVKYIERYGLTIILCNIIPKKLYYGFLYLFSLKFYNTNTRLLIRVLIITKLVSMIRNGIETMAYDKWQLYFTYYNFVMYFSKSSYSLFCNHCGIYFEFMEHLFPSLISMGIQKNWLATVLLFMKFSTKAIINCITFGYNNEGIASYLFVGFYSTSIQAIQAFIACRDDKNIWAAVKFLDVYFLKRFNIECI